MPTRVLHILYTYVKMYRINPHCVLFEVYDLIKDDKYPGQVRIGCQLSPPPLYSVKQCLIHSINCYFQSWCFSLHATHSTRERRSGRVNYEGTSSEHKSATL